MSQADDETNEHPAYPVPPGSTPPEEPIDSDQRPAAEPADEPAPIAAEPPPPLPGPPPFEPPAPSAAEPAAVPARPVNLDDAPTEELQLPPTPAGSSATPPWQQAPPAQQTWQQPGAPQWQQGQQWQGPPPAPGQWQQPPQQWQGQPQWQGPPGYPPPPGWAGPAQEWTGPQYATSALVALAAFVLVLFGLFIAVLGAWTLTQGPEISRFIRDNDIAVFGRQIDRETLRAGLSPMPGILMFLGVLQLLVGAAVFAHKNWARVLAVLLSIIGLVVGVFAVSTAIALAPGVSVPMIVAVVLLLGYAYSLLALITGGSHFRPRYPSR